MPNAFPYDGMAPKRALAMRRPVRNCDIGLTRRDSQRVSRHHDPADADDAPDREGASLGQPRQGRIDPSPEFPLLTISSRGWWRSQPCHHPSSPRRDANYRRGTNGPADPIGRYRPVRSSRCGTRRSCNMLSKLAAVGEEPPMTRIQNPIAAPVYWPLPYPSPVSATVGPDTNSLWQARRPGVLQGSAGA